MGQKIDDTVWQIYGFQDSWAGNYRQSYRAQIEGDSWGFYALRQGLRGDWYAWYFPDKDAMENTCARGRIFFGFSRDGEEIKDRVYSHMILTKLGQFAPEELAAAQEEYRKNFAPEG